MNNAIDHSPYLATGDPKTSVETTMYRPGELGHVHITRSGKRYQKVQLENSTLTLAIAVKQLAYWKDRSTKTVTFDSGDAEGGLNAPAGLLESGSTVPTAGQYFWLLQEGNNVVGLSSAVTWGALDVVIPGAVGRVTNIAAGTAPTYLAIGVTNGAAQGALSAGADVTFDLCIPSSL